MTGPIAVESSDSGGIGAGTIILTAPSGFAFNTNAAVAIKVTGGSTAANNINHIANGSMFSAASVTAPAITITITSASTGSGNYNTLTWQGIQIRPTAGTLLGTTSVAAVGGVATYTNLINTVTDTIGITSSDATAVLPGSVQFYVNDTALGSPLVLAYGVANLSTADLPVGTNIILAVYPGNSTILGSSNSLAQVVSLDAETPSILRIQANSDSTVTVSFSGDPGESSPPA